MIFEAQVAESGIDIAEGQQSICFEIEELNVFPLDTSRMFNHGRKTRNTVKSFLPKDVSHFRTARGARRLLEAPPDDIDHWNWLVLECCNITTSLECRVITISMEICSASIKMIRNTFEIYFILGRWTNWISRTRRTLDRSSNCCLSNRLRGLSTKGTGIFRTEVAVVQTTLP